MVLLNWRGWHDTLECLQTLKQSNYSNLTIVVVDNDSQDESVEHICQAHPDITLLVSERNLGFAGGNNIGIKHALSKAADYVWLLNNDTKVFANTLETMIDVAQRRPAVGAVGSVLYEMSHPESIQVWGGGLINLWTGMSKHVKQPSQLDYLIFASVLIRREVWEQIGMLDEQLFMYWEDADYCFRLRKAGWQLEVAEASRVLHKESSSSGKGSPLLDRLFHNSALIFFKRYAFLPWLAIGISFGSRILKRIMLSDWTRVKVIWQVLQGRS